MDTSIPIAPELRAISRKAALLLIAAGVIAVLASVPIVFNYGPLVEARLFKVLDIQPVEITPTKDIEGKPLLCFKIEVNKFRPCELTAASYRWLLDHQVEGAPVFFANTGLPFQPNTSVSVGALTTREVCSPIPQIAYNFKEMHFKGTLFYSCHALWNLPYSFDILMPTPPARPVSLSSIRPPPPIKLAQ